MMRIKPYWYLPAGIALIAAAHLTYGIGILAWVACIPFLLYLGSTKGIWSRLLFILALIIAWSLATWKILSPPMPVAMVFLYSVPLSLVQLPGYLLWAGFRERRFAVLIFPAVMVTMEWLQYTYTPLASWGAAAYTQVNSLILLQSLSLFGMAGLGFLIYWVNSALAESLLASERNYRKLKTVLSLLLLTIIFGSLRLSLSEARGVETVAVAAVGTDSKIVGLPLPAEEVMRKDNTTLLQRTGSAAHSGAKIVVWNEGSTAILPVNERAWQDTLASLAAKERVALVAAYIVPISVSPLQYENKFLLIMPDGKIAYSYHKHEPVPGEPAIKGKERIQTVALDQMKAGGAICYDYDFPYLAAEWGRLGTDLVALPSSDWRGIDPIHTQMAACRAIEQGQSVLRSTRFGLSAAITPYGQMVAMMSSFDSNDRIMIAHLPQKRVKTLYSKTGDVLVYACIVFISGFLIWTGLGGRIK